MHRLLKNSVPSREYLLVTRETMERLPADIRPMFRPHSEEYDLGAVECGWIDLAPLRSDPRANEEVKVVDPEHAILTFERVYDVPKDRLWATLTDPAARARWMGDDVQRVDYEPGARRTMLGGEYHCYHGHGESTVFRIMEATRPARLTVLLDFGGIMVWNTTTLDDVQGGTKLASRYHFDVPAGAADDMVERGRHMLVAYEQSALVNIARELDRGTQATAPA